MLNGSRIPVRETLVCRRRWGQERLTEALFETGPCKGHHCTMSESQARARAECEGMSTKDLKKKARELGIGSKVVDEAGDEGAEALIALIVQASVTPAEKLAQECEGMSTKELKQKARGMGIGSDEVDEAGDEGTEALIALIVQNRRLSPEEMLAQECEGLSMKDLKKKARGMGIGSDEVDEAGDDGKSALIALIAQNRGTPVREPQPVPMPEPEPMPEPMPMPVAVTVAPVSSASDSQLASFRNSTERKLLELVNEVQDISLESLGMDGGDGAKLDWPQICVVGGQAEGKSTLLSAIVSANMSAKMEFLPEGTGMVTRCPISVQMTFQKDGDHSASVSTQRGGGSTASEGVPGEGGVIPGPGAEPTPQQLADWGFAIQQRITGLQDHIVPAGQVTAQKIIVRLRGPTLPNLSLVDLPGLRAVDDERTQGLKEKLKEMVINNLRSPSAIILCVGPAGTDPSTWVGRGLAKQIDPWEERTIGVVTKVDTIFQPVDTELQRDNQAQLKTVLDEARKTPYYAAYNPKPGDEQKFVAAGINLKDDLEKVFAKGRVGNGAIARDLETRLTGHLQEQLPDLYERFKEKCKELDSILQESEKPTWSIVEQVMLSYTRQVQGYSMGSGRDPAEVVRQGGLEDGERDDGAPIWPYDESLQGKMMILMQDFKYKTQPEAVYRDEGAERSILHRSTEEILADAKKNRQKTELVAQNGIGWVQDPINFRKDDEVAKRFAERLTKDLVGLCGDVLQNIRDALLPLCNEFYEAVAHVTFTLEEYPGQTFQLQEFPELKKKLLKATRDRLQWNWERVEKKAEEGAAIPDITVVDEAWMKITEVQAALTRVCELAGQTTPQLAVGGGLGARTISVARTTPLVVDSPPEGDCRKQKPTGFAGDPLNGGWPPRYAKIMPNAQGSMGLYVFDNQVDSNEPGKARNTSIINLTGCTFQLARQAFAFNVSLCVSQLVTTL